MSTYPCLIFLLVILASCSYFEAVGKEESPKKEQGGGRISDKEITFLSDLNNASHMQEVLNALLIPRVVGTANHKFVQQYLIQCLKDLGWHIEIDRFMKNTPVFGALQFSNIIARLNPGAQRFLVFACHYDSKYFRENAFIGATDSAVPCAMMINLAATLRQQLEDFKEREDISMMMIFFDGEEAFRYWSPKDSLYGSRHLAAKWESMPYLKNGSNDSNYLKRIDLFVLLDLLGAPDPSFYSYFFDTHHWYRLMTNIERKLSELGLLMNYSRGKSEQLYFKSLSSPGNIDDDHVPFLTRGVPILHLIPYPFPNVWHTEHDNKEAVDMTTVENLNKIFRVFTAIYLGFSPCPPKS